jgi:outer membrane protein OmpA-like peptidoglycan-associated protein
MPWFVRPFLVAVILCGTAAAAQERGFRLHRYEGSSAGNSLFLLERPTYSARRFGAAGLTLDYSRNPLVPALPTGRGAILPIVSQALVGHLDLSVSFFDRVLVSGSLPVTLLESGTVELVSQSGPLQGLGVGDPRIGLMVRLAGQADSDAFSIHLGADVWIPVGAQGTHQGDVAFRLMPRAVLAGSFLEVGRWTVDAGFLLRPYASIGPPALGMTAASEARVGVGVGVALAQQRLFIGPEAQFAVQVAGENAFVARGMNLELLGGAQYLIADRLLVGVAGGTGLFGAAGTPDARAIFRVAWAPRRDVTPERIVAVELNEPPANDPDLDAIVTALDRCPYEPENINGVRDQDGCPEFALERGTPLARVLAPLSAPSRAEASEAGNVSEPGNRAPRAPPATSADAGSVAVSAPSTLGGNAPDAGRVAVSAPSTLGGNAPDAGSLAVSAPSPVGGNAPSATSADAGNAVAGSALSSDSATALFGSDAGLDRALAFATADSDGDGVPDEADRCPVAREDLDGFEDEDGCPEADNDEDGLIDTMDRCPVEGETLNALEDGDGCPDLAPDADADGVADAVDRCPFEPENLDGVRDQDGCPEHRFVLALALDKLLEPRRNEPLAPSPDDTRAPIDSDGDKVSDDEDRCPVTAEDGDGFEDEDGCREADNDDDSIVDALDKCPESAETLNGWKDGDGCPDEHQDIDGDGVAYEVDRCPFEPGDASDGCPHALLPALALAGFPAAPPQPANDAVPAPVTADFDRDGTTDDADVCPVTPEDSDGFEDEDGCPEPDDDHDGIEDKKDKCPFVAETINGNQDDDGCPDRGVGVVTIQEKAVVIDGVVSFKTASASLQPASLPLLKQVASTLKAAATLSIEIRGHTDDVGNAAKNITLSKRRAETIRAVLIKAGVKPARLISTGFGPTRPRATNKTAAGREQNRRVEFLILGESK